MVRTWPMFVTWVTWAAKSHSRRRFRRTRFVAKDQFVGPIVRLEKEERVIS